MFVLNCVDGCIPSDLATGSSEEIEEERRLLYVAMTRAKDELALIVPQRFYVHGQPKNGDRSVFAGRTRFIPPPLLKHFERQTWPAAAAAPARARVGRPARGPGRADAGDVAVSVRGQGEEPVTRERMGERSATFKVQGATKVRGDLARGFVPPNTGMSGTRCRMSRMAEATKDCVLP